MKKIIILIVFCLFDFVCFAQDKKQQTLLEVRQAYSNCMQLIKDRDEEPNVIEYSNFTISENWPGSGRRQKIIEVYYSLRFNEEIDMSYLGPNIKFIRVKYNWGSIEYLEEYVYDFNEIIFVFYKEYTNSMSTEIRIYNKNGIFILDKKTSDGNIKEHPIDMQVLKSDKEIFNYITKGQDYQRNIRFFLENN